MVSRSVTVALASVAAIAASCLSGSAAPMASAATSVSSAVHNAATALPSSAVPLPRPVSQKAATYTPNVYPGGVCSSHCNHPQVYSTVVVGGEAIVAGEFGQVCTPAAGATYAPCPQTVNADFIFAFNLSTGMIDPGFTPVLDRGPVYSLAAGPGNTVYLGGGFSTVNGQGASRVAQLHVDPGGSDDGQLVAGFAGTANGDVTSLAYSGNALYLAGDFGTVDNTAAKVARINATTGDFDSSFNFSITNPPSGTTVKVKTLALSPDGSTLAIAGTFLQVNGQSIPRLALLNTGGGLGSAATVDNWAAPILNTDCTKQQDFINAVDFSPDGSYLVIADTGYKTTGGPAVCDSAVRFDAAPTGNVQPVWQNFAGGDSLDSVLIAGNVVYIGGHNRWLNNECGNNRVCEPDAVLEDGIGAVDANTGVALAWWHPQTGRGTGLRSLTAFPAGAFPGSDGGLLVGAETDKIGGAIHDELAMFPETATGAAKPGGPIMSGIFSAGRPGVDEESGAGAGVAAECVDDAGNSTTPGSPVKLVTCSNDNEQNWTIDANKRIEINGLCLDAPGTASPSAVVLNTCTHAASQQWQPGTGNRLVNQASGLCLDDPGASTTSGTALDVATCMNGLIEQSWPLPSTQAPPPPPPAGPLYSQQIQPDTNVPCLRYSGTKVTVSECLGTSAENWTVESNGTIVAGGQCLDTQGEGTANGTAVVLANCNGSPTQVWTYQWPSELLEDGPGNTKCLYAPSLANGSQPVITACSSANNSQKWRLPTY